MKPNSPESPPRWATRFLNWYCAPDLLEEVQGDIDELFFRNLAERDLSYARKQYGWDVLRFCNYSTIKGRGDFLLPQPSLNMFRNYLKIAIRNLIYQREYTLINILGLALGLCCVILLSIYSQDELTFDTFHSKSDRIYRLIDQYEDPESGLRKLAVSPNPASAALVADFPQFTHAVPLLQFGQGVITVSDTLTDQVAHFNERSYLFAGPSFFQVFDFPLIAGNKDKVLSDPQQVVLTESAARRYFGTENPIGKTITFNRAGDLIVSGLLADPPQNSHLNFEFIVSLETMLTNERAQAYFQSWEQSGLHQYVLAQQPISPTQFQPELDEFNAAYRGEEANIAHLSLQPLSDIHFGSEAIEYELLSSEETKRSKTYLIIFGWVSLLVLLIAGINYVNLATARAMRRGKEIGIRKVVGAYRGQLIAQFLVESILTACLAMLIAIALSYLLMAPFNELAHKSLSMNLWQQPGLLLYLIGVTLLVGFLAGIFPAFFLSNFQIIQVLKGIFKSGSRGTYLRRSLVVTQFVATLCILVATLIVYQQMRYVQTKDLGFNEEQLLIIDINSGTARSKFEVFKSEFAKHSNVKQVSATYRVPGEWKNIDQATIFPKQSGKVDSLESLFFCFDEDALETFEMELVAGANFSGNVAVDSTAFLINETAARMLGWEQPVGQFVSVSGVPYPMKVIGVVKDFHVRSLHETIGPLVIGYWANPIRSIDYFACKIGPHDIPGTLDHFAEVQTRLDPDTPLEYHFLDQQIDLFYAEDKRVGKIFIISALLTLLIACMGLFGLIAYSISQRTKEVGIRKVLGASAAQLWLLLSREIFLLIGIAILIAIPVSWWLAASWLSSFAFAIPISWLVFAIAGAAVLGVALLSVGYHITRMARSKPVDSLRYE